MIISKVVKSRKKRKTTSPERVRLEVLRDFSIDAVKTSFPVGCGVSTLSTKSFECLSMLHSKIIETIGDGMLRWGNAVSDPRAR